MDFLENLYWGNIDFCEMPPRDSKTAKKALSTLAECETKLLNNLTEEEKTVFLKELDAQSTLITETSVGNFKRGFRCAMLLWLSCFDSDITE